MLKTNRFKTRPFDYLKEREIIDYLRGLEETGSLRYDETIRVMRLMDEINDNEENRFPGCKWDPFLECLADHRNAAFGLFEGRQDEFGGYEGAY